jgi:hypothetical protein
MPPGDVRYLQGFPRALRDLSFDRSLDVTTPGSGQTRILAAFMTVGVFRHVMRFNLKEAFESIPRWGEGRDKDSDNAVSMVPLLP